MLRIILKKGMVMELEGYVCKSVGNMVGIRASATGKTYHLFQYGQIEGTNVYHGTLYAGKKRMKMTALLL